jgi:hypothetical protein
MPEEGTDIPLHNGMVMRNGVPRLDDENYHASPLKDASARCPYEDLTDVFI